MRKLLAALLAVVLGIGCMPAMAQTAGEAARELLAEIVIPLTVDEMLVSPVIMPKPAEYTLTYEDGYYIVETDWFDEHEQANTKEVSLKIDSNRQMCLYNADREAYISQNAMEEGTLMELFFKVCYKTNDGGYDVSWRVNYIESWDGTVGYEEEMDVVQFDTNSDEVFSYDGQGNLTLWSRGYSISDLYVEVYFDENGETSVYNYALPGYISGYLIAMDSVDYDVDGTLIGAVINVDGVSYFYQYDPYNGDEYWYNEETGSEEPPAGYSRAKLYELYPPLVGSIPDLSIPGDADNDGEVVLTDALALIKNLAGDMVDVSAPAADVNVDGAVDVKDFLLILQHFAGWGVELK